MLSENIYAVSALASGAKGFVSKDASVDELTRAILITMEGRTYLSSAITEILSTQKPNALSSPFDSLTSRELQIVSLLLRGNTVTQISKMLDLKNSTIGTHKGTIFKKLRVENLIELKMMADLYKV